MKKHQICTNCGFTFIKGKKAIQGSIFIEIILWLTFIVPGLIYSIWRLTTKYITCPQCRATNFVPVESRHGRKLIKNNI